MNVDAALSGLESLLEDERIALRSMSSDAVARIAEAKEAHMTTLAGATLTATQQQHFRILNERMRANARLLAHASNCVRSVLDLLTKGQKAPYISIRG